MDACAYGRFLLCNAENTRDFALLNHTITPMRTVCHYRPRCMRSSRRIHAREHGHRRIHRNFSRRRCGQIYAFSYSYDATGNRLQMRREATAGVETESAYYSYAADNSLTKKQVVNPPAAPVNSYFYYDANGSRTVWVESGNATYYGYNASNLPTVVAPPSESATYFYYDGLLNRYCEIQAGTAAYFLWDAKYNLLDERNADGSLRARYANGFTPIKGIGSVVEVQRAAGGATYYQYPVMDHRGSVYATVDNGQNTQLTYTTDAFGRQLAGVGGAVPTLPNDLIAQSNVRMRQIGGKWYLIFRYRIVPVDEAAFTSRDFLGYFNKYRLWSNNPANQVDRDGLASATATPTAPSTPAPGVTAPSAATTNPSPPSTDPNETGIFKIQTIQPQNEPQNYDYDDTSASETSDALREATQPTHDALQAVQTEALYQMLRHSLGNSEGAFDPNMLPREDEPNRDRAIDPAAVRKNAKDKADLKRLEEKADEDFGSLSPMERKRLSELREKFNQCGTCNCSCDPSGVPRGSPHSLPSPGQFGKIRTEEDCRNACKDTPVKPPFKFYWCSKNYPIVKFKPI